MALDNGSLSGSKTQGGKDKPMHGHQTDHVLSSLQNARTILSIARDIAIVAPVPFVGAILSSAGIIVETACQVHRNKREWADLAQRVACIARDIRKAIRDREDLVGNDLMESLNQLHTDYKDIQTCIEKESKRKLLSRVFLRDDISSRLTELSTRLSDSMQTFKSTSSIRLEIKVDEVKKMILQIDQKVARLDERMRVRRTDTSSTITTIAEHEESLSVTNILRSPVQMPWDAHLLAVPPDLSSS